MVHFDNDNGVFIPILKETTKDETKKESKEDNGIKDANSEDNGSEDNGSEDNDSEIEDRACMHSCSTHLQCFNCEYTPKNFEDTQRDFISAHYITLELTYKIVSRPSQLTQNIQKSISTIPIYLNSDKNLQLDTSDFCEKLNIISREPHNLFWLCKKIRDGDTEFAIASLEFSKLY